MHIGPRETLYHLAQFVAQRGGLGQWGFGQQDNKLFTAITGHHIRDAHVGAQNLGNLFEHHVARSVGVGVIDALKEINIPHHHRHGVAVAHGLLKQLLRLFIKMAAVVEVGQRIPDAHFLELVGLLQNGLVGLLQSLMALCQFFAHLVKSSGQRGDFATALHRHLLPQSPAPHGGDSPRQMAQRGAQAIA